ncbi:hypothetical protein BJ912DRAFT_984102 [Pholiota molesta]|nr:hypothetical protein BJ912DRAFT_984102 [Pholiota molesta]
MSNDSTSITLIPVQYPRSELENIPTEILVEIFAYMGWRDVLMCRLTCKRLHEVSTARPLWVSFFHRLSAELMPPPILERPVGTYTGEELEHIVLRRISSEVRWTSERPPTVRNVPITIDHQARDCTLLLEGGRWLLLTSPQRGSGRVYAYDLNSPFSQEPQCIIDLGKTSGGARKTWRMAADVDSSESQLTFNFCLVPHTTFEPFSFSEKNDDPSMPLADIHIYRLTLNGHGSDAVLVADKIKTLRNYFRTYSDPITLRGRYLARALCIPGTTSTWSPSYIEVCDWVLSDDSKHLKLLFDVEYVNTVSPLSCLLLTFMIKYITQEHIALLPDRKLVAVSDYGVYLYDIANLQSAPPGELPAVSTIKPYWKHSHSTLYARTHLSKPYLHQDATRVALAADGAIYGLVIPRHSVANPWYGRLFDKIGMDTLSASLGIDKACVVGYSGELEIASYLWPGDECKTNDVPSLLVPTVCYKTWDSPYEWSTYEWSHYPLFDERSNRLFVVLKGDSCAVIDYAYQ